MVLWRCCCTGKSHPLQPIVKAESQLLPERHGRLPTDAQRTVSEWTCAALHVAIILVWALPSLLSALLQLKCLPRPKGLYLSVSRHSSKCILLPNIKSLTEGKKSKTVSQVWHTSISLHLQFTSGCRLIVFFSSMFVFLSLFSVSIIGF